MHPFLDEGFHVRWSTLVPEAVEPDIRHALEIAKANLEAVCQVTPAEATYENTFGAFEKANDLLNLGWGRLQHLDSVADEPAQRAALNAMLPEVSEHYAAIPLNPRLWAVLKANGCKGTASHPAVIEMVQAGVTVGELRKAIAEAFKTQDGPLNPAYLAAIVDRLRTAPKSNGKANAWATDERATEAKARELGLWPAKGGESWDGLRGRIRAKLESKAAESVR